MNTRCACAMFRPRRPLRPLLIFLGLVYLLFVVTHLTGCATEPLTRSLQPSPTWTCTPQQTYAVAAQTLARMGGQVQVADPQSRVITGVVNGNTQLNITVDDQCGMQVTSKILPGKIVWNDVNPVDAYMAQIKKDLAHAR